MIMPTSLIAFSVIAFPTNSFAFQQHSFPRWPRHGIVGINSPEDRRGRGRGRGAPSRIRSAALSAPNDELHENIPPPSPKGVIFDMDGTLIRHSIDFAEMRRRIYAVADECPIGKTLERDCVLALSTKLSPDAMARCDEIFADIEQRAIDNMKINPGGAELIHFLRENGVRRAVLTRNLERNVSFMSDLYLDEMSAVVGDDPIFHPLVARDTTSHPDAEEPLKAKPNPDGILHICKVWGCDPSEVMMVGDSANDDMTAANRAGCGGAVLLTQGGGKLLDTDSGYEVGDSEEEILERTPSLRVESLLELKGYFEGWLNEGDEKKGDQSSMVYESKAGYSVVIPSIGVKKV